MISVFKNINCFAGKWKSLDALAIFCALYLPYCMVLFLLVYAIASKNWQIVFYPLISALFARFVVDSLIYFFYKEKRPAYFDSAKVLILIPKNPSFPSSHATVFSAISFSLFFFNVPLGIIFMILTCFIGTARVFCGVHWFRDILGGFTVGCVSSIIIYYLLNSIKI